ncbi:MAG TPA: chemotaxis response regulator protein-glutamate methylesterase [Anaerolineae bacterium]|nr:chemotaxis response regulator protein-glutamate methylesterase [Anaerolineae bacterium]
MIQTPIRVLIVDDTAFVRHIVTKHLKQDPALTVVGTAVDGEHALVQLEALEPDVVIMDVEMPNMDGLTALKEIMRRRPTPVIMLSSVTTHRAAQPTIRALMRGAVDFVAKPTQNVDLPEVMATLREKVKMAVGTGPRLSGGMSQNQRYSGVGANKRVESPFLWRVTDPLIVIGTSTGGPRALHQLLTSLPANLGAGMVIVQHMPPLFTRSLAERLDRHSPLTVREAVMGERLAKGVALLAPGDYHMRLEHKRVLLDQGVRVHHVRPAVDVTLESAVKMAGSKVVAVILTGMGQDGTAGAELVRQAGGTVIAEAESTSVVYGMPRSVIEAGVVDYIRPLSDIGSLLIDLVGHQDG